MDMGSLSIGARSDMVHVMRNRLLSTTDLLPLHMPKSKEINDMPSGHPQGAGSASQPQCPESVERRSRVPLYDLANGVFVANYNLALIPDMADGATSAMKREVWENKPRNDAIVDVARAVVESNAEQLHAYHIGGGKLPEELVGVRWLAILAGNKEHALAIHQLLPEAMLQYAAAGELMSLNASMAMPLLTVTTVMAAHQSRQFTPDVVINAIGGPHPLDLRRLVPEDAWGCHRVAIVELADEYCQNAAAATKQRLQRYAFQRVRVFDSGNRIGFDQSQAMFATGGRRGPSSPADLPSLSARSKGRGQRQSRRRRAR